LLRWTWIRSVGFSVEMLLSSILWVVSSFRWHPKPFAHRRRVPRTPVQMGLSSWLLVNQWMSAMEIWHRFHHPGKPIARVWFIQDDGGDLTAQVEFDQIVWFRKSVWRSTWGRRRCLAAAAKERNRLSGECGERLSQSVNVFVIRYIRFEIELHTVVIVSTFREM
jgi:hypothetical protein